MYAKKERLEIIVVDDASTDGTYKEVRKKFPEVKIIRNEKEVLLAKSRNIGIESSKGKYVFLIDDDNIVDRDCIQYLVKVMESDSKIGVAGPLMLYYSNPMKIWCAGGKLNIFLRPYHFLKGKYITEINLPDIIENIDYFPNAYMVRKEICEKVQHDNIDFPHNWEEQDFCIRVKRLGYKIVTVTSAKVWHDIDYDGYITRLGVFKTYDQAKSRIIFLKKYGNSLQRLMFWLIIFPISTIYYIYKILTTSSESKILLLRSYWKGTVDGIKWRGQKWD